LFSNLKNFIYIGLFQGTNFLAQIAFVPYLIKTVGGVHYGYLTIMYAICSFFFIVVDYGFSVTAVRKISTNKLNLLKIKSIIESTISSKIILTLISFPLFLVVSSFFIYPEVNFDFFILSFFAILGQAAFPTWLTLGLEENKIAFFVNLAGKLLLTVLVFTFISSKGDWKYFIFFIGVTNFLGGILLLLYLIKYKLKIRIKTAISSKGIISDLNEGKELFLSNFSIGFYSNSAVLILSHAVSPYMIGIYGVAEKIMLLFRNLTGVFIQAVYSGVCRKAQAMHPSHLIKYVTKINTPFIILILGLCIFSLMFNSSIAGMFVEDKDIELLSDIIMKFSFLPFFVSLNIIPNLVLFAYSKERIKSVILIFFATISIVCSYFLVPALGLDAMIGILYGTEILIALISIYFMKRLPYAKIPLS
jgi:PST family polysaccharide transporter